jgi:glycosyltransferase involved in cell wall biosynthesis
MRILWVGRHCLVPPFDGAALYSHGVMRACAALGAKISVVCLNPVPGRPLAPVSLPAIDWTVIEASPLPRILRALHWSLPAAAAGFRLQAYHEAVGRMLQHEEWDAIVIDTVALGTYLPLVAREARGRPALLYLAHNHESSSAYAGVRDSTIAFWLKAALLRNAAKIRRLENRVVAQCDAVLAITEADARAFRADHPAKRVVVVTPGYGGEVVPQRDLADSPRRALLLGSYDWIFKQINLEAFLRVASGPFEKAGISLRVAGKMPAAYRRRLARRFPHIDVAASGIDVRDELKKARIGLVIDRLGGGFKLKVLDYVFARVPIAAFRPAMRDGLLEPGGSYIAADTIPALVDGIVATFDDTAALSRLADGAFLAFRNAFDWTDRGRLVLDTIADIRARR